MLKQHFQIAYLADDAKAASEMIGADFGVSRWYAIESATEPMRYAYLAWAGDIMIEVIQPNELVPSLYSNWRGNGDSTLRFHHLGFFIDSVEEFELTKRQLAESGFPIVYDGAIGEMLEFAYADTTSKLGHFCELVLRKAKSDIFLERIPRN